MTADEIRAETGSYDKFPVGLRVLAVDDDPICLKLLETLLRKCQYHGMCLPCPVLVGFDPSIY